ncbi:MAG: hypothetical protein EBS35_05590 [Bacteroidetes bacterium]|nr:hypothetical protein [Bacteroidota bacterium]
MMRVHIIRDEFCPLELYQNVFEKLSKSEGIIQFIHSQNEILNSNDADDMNSQQEENLSAEKIFLSFSQLYNVCNAYRKKYLIDQKDHIFLLTGANNNQNWFSNMDYHENNYFVQVTEWDLFFGPEIEHSFVICYQIMAWLLKRNIFSSEKEVMDSIHLKPIGCVMDFCQQKKDITLKIRTADLCPKCLKLIKAKDISFNFLNQIFTLWEDIRKNIIFRERADFLNFKGRIIINPVFKTLTFPDFGGIQIRLPPKQMAFYQLFMSEIDGIYFAHLDNLKERLKDYYFAITGKDGSELDNIYEYPYGVASELISKINHEMNKNLGTTLASFYRIKRNTNGPHNIIIGREYVSVV